MQLLKEMKWIYTYQHPQGSGTYLLIYILYLERKKITYFGLKFVSAKTYYIVASSSIFCLPTIEI